MQVSSVLQLRSAIARFLKMADEEWEMLVPYLEERKLKKHALFAKEGKAAHDIGFLLDGNMRHFYTRDGEEKTTYFYFEGHFVASYISCITGTLSELTIEAMTDCTLLVFRYQDMQELFRRSHTWERFGRLLAEYLAAGLEERMKGLLMFSPEERYLQLLEGNRQKIMERIPQHYIANYLGVTPVSMSRIRSRLAKK